MSAPGSSTLNSSCAVANEESRPTAAKTRFEGLMAEAPGYHWKERCWVFGMRGLTSAPEALHSERREAEPEVGVEEARENERTNILGWRVVML